MKNGTSKNSKQMAEVFKEKGLVAGHDAWYCLNEHPNSSLRVVLLPMNVIEADAYNSDRILSFILEYVFRASLSEYILSDIQLVHNYKGVHNEASLKLVAETLKRVTKCDSICFSSDVSAIVSSIRTCPSIVAQINPSSSQSRGLSSQLADEVTTEWGTHDVDMGIEDPVYHAASLGESPSFIIVDIGASMCRVYPIVAGRVVSAATRCSHIGGETLTEYMSALLSAKPVGISAAFNSLPSMRKLQIAREIKEQFGFVSEGIASGIESRRQLPRPSSSSNGSSSAPVPPAAVGAPPSPGDSTFAAQMTGKASSWLRTKVTDFSISPKPSSASLSSQAHSGAATTSASTGTSSPLSPNVSVNRVFETTLHPENKKFSISVEKERHYCCEVLFSPRIYPERAHESGLVALITDAVQAACAFIDSTVVAGSSNSERSSAIAQTQKRSLCSTIIIAGPSSALPGLTSRVHNDLLDARVLSRWAGPSFAKLSVFSVEQELLKVCTLRPRGDGLTPGIVRSLYVSGSGVDAFVEDSCWHGMSVRTFATLQEEASVGRPTNDFCAVSEAAAFDVCDIISFDTDGRSSNSETLALK
jgi:hypothetical protein